MEATPRRATRFVIPFLLPIAVAGCSRESIGGVAGGGFIPVVSESPRALETKSHEYTQHKGAGASNGNGAIPALKPPEPERCRAIAAEPVRFHAAALRRLSWQEIANAWSDLFPGIEAPETRPHLERPEALERSSAAAKVNESFLREYVPVLEAFAARAGKSIATQCAAAGGDTRACVKRAVAQKAELAWKGEVPADAAMALGKALALFDARGDEAAATGGILLALTSARFLYLVDPGSLSADKAEPDGTFRATRERKAALLAASLWGSVPDAALLQAARDRSLDSPAGSEAQLARMLASPKARRGTKHFFRAWLGHPAVLGAPKDPQAFPGFDAALKAELALDTDGVLEDAFFERALPPSSLVTSGRAFPGPRMRAAYAMGANDGAGVDLDASQRSGVATHPSVLAITSKEAGTSTVQRGKYVVETLLCEHIPPPPPNADVLADELVKGSSAGNKSLRERMEEHSTNPACASCHRMLDPFGFALEGFDPMGRPRSVDGASPVRTEVKFDGVFGIRGEFAGPAPLFSAVAATGKVDRCYLMRLSTFHAGRPLDERQGCELLAPLEGGKASALSMRELALRAVASEIALRRAAPRIEGAK